MWCVLYIFIMCMLCLQNCHNKLHFMLNSQHFRIAHQSNDQSCVVLYAYTKSIVKMVHLAYVVNRSKHNMGGSAPVFIILCNSSKLGHRLQCNFMKISHHGPLFHLPRLRKFVPPAGCLCAILTFTGIISVCCFEMVAIKEYLLTINKCVYLYFVLQTRQDNTA